jgi:hypothetical protein
MMNWKGSEKKGSWPILRFFLVICLKVLRKSTKNLSQDSRPPGQDLNSGLPKYETRMLTVQLQRSKGKREESKFLKLHSWDILKKWDSLADKELSSSKQDNHNIFSFSRHKKNKMLDTTALTLLKYKTKNIWSEYWSVHIKQWSTINFAVRIVRKP